MRASAGLHMEALLGTEQEAHHNVYVLALLHHCTVCMCACDKLVCIQEVVMLTDARVNLSLHVAKLHSSVDCYNYVFLRMYMYVYVCSL